MSVQKRAKALILARSCPIMLHKTVVKGEADHERQVYLGCGLRKVPLPDRREELTLIVVKGFGQSPLMILTNLAVRPSRKSI